MELLTGDTCKVLFVHGTAKPSTYEIVFYKGGRYLILTSSLRVERYSFTQPFYLLYFLYRTSHHRLKTITWATLNHQYYPIKIALASSVGDDLYSILIVVRRSHGTLKISCYIYFTFFKCYNAIKCQLCSKDYIAWQESIHVNNFVTLIKN